MLVSELIIGNLYTFGDPLNQKIGIFKGTNYVDEIKVAIFEDTENDLRYELPCISIILAEKIYKLEAELI